MKAGPTAQDGKSANEAMLKARDLRRRSEYFVSGQGRAQFNWDNKTLNHKSERNKIRTKNVEDSFQRLASMRGFQCQVTCATRAYKGWGGHPKVILPSCSSAGSRSEKCTINTTCADCAVRSPDEAVV